MQIGISEIFNLLKIKSIEILGYSYGELLSVYCNGSLSIEETVNYGFLIDKALCNIKEIPEDNNNISFEVKHKSKPYSFTFI